MMNKLYDKDFYLWLKTTAKLLQEQKFAEIDLDNLIEEIESMGRSEKRELRNRLIVLLTHLLKWKYQPERRSNSWISTIVEQRIGLESLLLDSPSLKKQIDAILDDCYKKAVIKAAFETELSKDIFPSICPFTIESILSNDELFEG
jgi:hypothetical protein